MSASFDAVTDRDSNVWYHVSEMRVDDYKKKAFGNALQLDPDAPHRLNCKVYVDQRWQFVPVDTDKHKGRYSIRSSATGVGKQLSVCRTESEDARGKTQACMAESNGLDEQKWDITDFNKNDTFRFVNAQNGSKYWLDVHPGALLFLNDDTDLNIWRPAQRWVMTSAGKIDDETFSTTFTNASSSLRAVLAGLLTFPGKASHHIYIDRRDYYDQLIQIRANQLRG